MDKIKNLSHTPTATITVLVDNRADLIVKSTDTVRRYTKEPLLAEHGFAALIELGDRSDRSDAGVRILWDAGMTHIALLENMRRMQIDPATIDVIALSHGHGDHTAAMTEVIKAMGVLPKPRKWEVDATLEEIREWTQGRRVPLVAHPAAFRERWGIGKDGSRYGPALPPPRAEWEAVGAQVILSEGPYQLGPGCWTTGFVPRLSFEEAGRSSTRAYREGDAFMPDDLEDDQAIVIHVGDERGGQEKGLVVLAGCAHSGIVNTVRYARQISGVDRIRAIIGGFHLAPASDEEIERTIDEIAEMQPAMVVPSHCTGFKAICQFSRRMPDSFVLGVVGTTYLF
jgi:7,8-dihydropterin-6-yl-methyl-4-(beta-D-ribofuranosyl)aminobenzene 5'-phosphate synthase